MKNSDASSSRGFYDRPYACVKIGSPDGSEAVGHLSKDSAGAERLFRAVVCRRDITVGDEDEEVLAEFLDNALKFLPGLGCWSNFQQLIELALQSGMISDQGGVGQLWPAAAHADRPFQQRLERWAEGVVAAIDGILDIALQVGLMPTSA